MKRVILYFINICRAVTLIELLIAVALFSIILIPIISTIINSNRKIHELNFEITAELIGKNILEQIVNIVPFDKVTKNITVGINASNDVRLDFTDKSIIKTAEFSGDKSGSFIRYEQAEYKWEIEVIDIDAKDLSISFWEPRNEKPEGSSAWPRSLIGTKSDGILKTVKYENLSAHYYVKNEQNIILKTVKLKISWQNANEQSNNFRDEHRKFILVTRKARLEYDNTFK